MSKLRILALSMIMVFGLFSGLNGHIDVVHAKVVQYENGIGG